MTEWQDGLGGGKTGAGGKKEEKMRVRRNRKESDRINLFTWRINLIYRKFRMTRLFQQGKAVQLWAHIGGTCKRNAYNNHRKRGKCRGVRKRRWLFTVPAPCHFFREQSISVRPWSLQRRRVRRQLIFDLLTQVFSFRHTEKRDQAEQSTSFGNASATLCIKKGQHLQLQPGKGAGNQGRGWAFWDAVGVFSTKNCK